MHPWSLALVTHHAPLGLAPALTCGACHSTPVHLHPWSLVSVPTFGACHCTPIHLRPWGLAPIPIMHSWVWQQHPRVELVMAPQFIPNSSTPLGSSSSTCHAPLGSAPAPTCGACHSTPIHLCPWGLAPVPVMHPWVWQQHPRVELVTAPQFIYTPGV